MTTRHKTHNVGPIDSNTGKPFYTPAQWARIQAHDAEEARAHDEAVAKARATRAAYDRPKPLTGPSPTGAQMGQANPAGPAGGKVVTIGEMMPAQHPPIPPPSHRAHDTRRPTAPRVPASIVPPPSPSAGPHPLAAVAALRDAVGHAPAAAAPTSTGGIPAPPALNTAGQGGVLGQQAQDNALQALHTVLGSNVNPGIAQAALSWFEKMQAEGAGPDQINNEMYNQQWFKTAFPGIAQQVKNGDTNVMSPIDYSAGQAQVKQSLMAMGADPALASGDLYANLIGQGYTPTQITGRLGLAIDQARGDIAHNPLAMQLLHQYYGIAPNPSAVAAFYMTGDPKTAGQLTEISEAVGGGGQAMSAGFTKLDQRTLLGLAQQGVTGEAIGQAAKNAVGEIPLSSGGPTGLEDSATSDEILMAATGKGIPGGETGAQATEAVDRALAGRNLLGAGKGGGAGELGTPNNPGGAGFGTQ